MSLVNQYEKGAEFWNELLILYRKYGLELIADGREDPWIKVGILNEPIEPYSVDTWWFTKGTLSEALGKEIMG